MARLLYVAITSLDGYVAGEHGEFDWSAPDHEVHAFVNDLQREIGTLLLGRRMYDVLQVWETMGTPDAEPVVRDFARSWLAADKIVYSRSLDAAATARTRIERRFDPEAIRQMKAAAIRDLGVGGADLAGQALRAGLVDDVHLVVNPVLVGGGTRALPDGVRADLALVDEHRFDSGVVHLHYRIR
jgi:dihydrofolate reductase